MKSWFKIAVFIVLGVGLVLLFFNNKNRKVKDITLVELILIAFLVSFMAGSIKDLLREQDYSGMMLKRGRVE